MKRLLALVLIGGVLNMAIAPLVSDWYRLPRSRPVAPVAAPRTLGVPILTADLGPGARMVVEIAWGAVLSNPDSTWTWYDVTTDVLFEGPVSITPIGRADESSVAQPAGCSFTLQNPDSRYSASNPLSVNWPNVVRNTPVRVRVTLDNGANWWVRFQGNANGFTPGWDTSANISIVTVSASGIFRRLMQGKTPLRSPLERAIVANAPLAYWPLEDGSNTTIANSPISGVAPMRQFVDDGTTYALPQFATVEAPHGSDLLPNFNNGGTLAAQVTGGTAGTTGWTGEFIVNFGATTPTDTFGILLLELQTGVDTFQVSLDMLNQKWQLAYLTNSHSTSTPISNPTWASTFSPFDGTTRILRVSAKQNGANIDWEFKLYLTNGGAWDFLGSIASRTLRPITSVVVGPQGDDTSFQMGMGHVSVWNKFAPPDHVTPLNGHAGETPLARLSRLCSEEGVPFERVGFYDTNTTMGPQGVDTLLNLLRECEKTDAGFLYDGLSAGLRYQGISQRYDQAVSMTLDMAAGDLAPPFAPVDDDQRNRNLVKATRKNGSFAIYEDVDGPLGTGSDGSGGIGVYDDEVVVNPEDESRLDFRARWEVHTGTIEGLRYPTLSLNLRASPNVAIAWLNNSNGFGGAVLPGSRVDITNVEDVTTQHAPGTLSVVLEGWAEQISPFVWTVAGNCVANRIYDVWKIGDSILGRVQTRGTYLTADTAVGGTSLSVQTIDPAGWVTTALYPTDFPLYVEVDGIQVKVTAATGSGSAYTFTVDGSTVTKPLLTGKAVKMWHNGVLKF